MKRFEHGGDVHAHPDAVDFSANLNPLGMPAAAKQALCAAVDTFDVYPDADSGELASAIAEREGVPRESVLVCAGATDAMTRVCLALRPKRALVCAPCYSGYEQALEQAGAEIVRHELRESADFALDDTILARLSGSAGGTGGTGGSTGSSAGSTGGIDVAFIANPNNPTGLTVARPLLERILAEACERGVVVVLDECFIDFTEERSAADLIGRFANLVIVKAFTKIYAMAGLRLGYLICADDSLVARFAAMGQMWAVSTPAQVAGAAVLGEDGFVERSRAYVAARRAELLRELEALGLRVIPGQANYLMFESPRALYEPLLERGILVRRCENYVGLGDTWFRVAVRTTDENAQLIAALKEVLK